MDDCLQRLKKEARQLTPQERLELVEDLLSDADGLVGPFADAWAEEAAGRLAALRAGDLDTVPLSDVVDSTDRT